jgi:hypothetical protein
MICPVMSHDKDSGWFTCFSDKCAWWIPTRGCAVQVVAKEMVHDRLGLVIKREWRELSTECRKESVE